MGGQTPVRCPRPHREADRSDFAVKAASCWVTSAAMPSPTPWTRSSRRPAALERQNVGVVLVGQGVEKDRLRRRAEHLGLEHTIFLPPLAKELVPSLLAELDACYIGWTRSPLVPVRYLSEQAFGLHDGGQAGDPCRRGRQRFGRGGRLRRSPFCPRTSAPWSTASTNSAVLRRPSVKPWGSGEGIMSSSTTITPSWPGGSWKRSVKTSSCPRRRKYETPV